ncbi:hypothetical protein [Demequina phytophila]|uniref:hypothetical protein n=1 Tax=Demequina phytophila TaxID=1638981 RepID=UPI0007849264|nr:hypothetical protein [Demequina phytophila]
MKQAEVKAQVRPYVRLTFAFTAVAALAGCTGAQGDADAFELTDPAVAIVATDEGAALRISGTVANTSDDVLDDVAVAVVLDEGLDDYIPAGAATLPVDGVDHIYPADTPRSEVPSDGARGIELEDTRHLEGTGDYLNEVADLAGALVVKVTWDGGEQTLTTTTEVLDPDGLLAG